jgi:tripartite ATP-independent transporter DctM subunit
MIGIAVFAVLLILFTLGVHIATVLFVLGAGAGIYGLGYYVLLDFGRQAWIILNSFVMVAIPIYILLGELLLRSGVADSMYQCLSLWLSRLPGGLLHTNIAASALVAANSGSSVATAATFGTIAIPTFVRKNYNKRVVLGSLAAGGTLGILIPPSINMIIYGSIADASIGHLFIGGIIPGLILALGFIIVIAIIAVIKPSIAGTPEPRVSLMDKLRMLPALLAPAFIILAVMGSIYLGWATPTESAALGVCAILIITFLKGRLSISVLHESFVSTVRTTSMIYLIVTGAFYLNYVLALLGVPQDFSRWFAGLHLEPKTTLLLIMIFYILLGCFMDAIAMMITTIPIIVPLIVSVGYDPLWFGVFLTACCECGLITPPVGMNLYVIQGVRPDKGPFKDVVIGALPFLVVIILLLIILIYFPDLVLWLPKQMI